MNKIFVFISVIAVMSLLTLSGCREKGIQTISGQVRNLVMDGDTLKGIVVFINEHQDTMAFTVDEAQFQNGVSLPKDSVIVDFIYGQNDINRALVVTVIPKVVPFDAETPTTDTLVTAPMIKPKK